ncbi:MAG: BrnT family toxin [Deltaproteobacteria bacterium]|nr:BrnT family toxin [Deltaproteobacteria bacterium]
MIIEGFIWITDIVDKLDAKHGVSVAEVESAFTGEPFFSRIQKGKVKGEDLYRALGTSDSGRPLSVFFLYKATREASVVSARDMSQKERKYYAKRKR